MRDRLEIFNIDKSFIIMMGSILELSLHSNSMNSGKGITQLNVDYENHTI